MPNKLPDQICKICGHVNEVSWYTAKEMMFGFRDEFNYFQCPKCECLQISEFPDNISKYYPENYYSLTQNDEVKFYGLRGILRRISLSSLIFSRNIFDKALQK